MNLRTTLPLILSAGCLLAVEAARGDDTAEAIQGLRRHIEELEEKVRLLEQRSELSKAAKTATPEASTIEIGSNGVVIGSTNSEFKLRLRGYLQADGRFFLNDSRQTSADTFVLSRVRPTLEGTVFKRFDFKLMPDFGQGKTLLQDAYVDARFLPALNLRVGKFKSPVGLERLQSARDLVFVERGLPTDLVPNRDVGVALHGSFLDGALNYEAGIFNGAPDGGSDDTDENDCKDAAARLFVHPFRPTGMKALHGLGIGVAGTFGHEQGAVPAYKTIGQQTFFSFNNGVTASGNRHRISPQGYYYCGPFGLLGEYVLSEQEVKKGAVKARLGNSAWQVAASWVLTGEKASYTGVTPARPFAPQENQWGAFEIAARVGQLEVDPVAFHNFGTPAAPNTLADPAKSAVEATAWAVALNWYLNKDVRFSSSFSRTTFDRAGGAGPGAAFALRQPAEEVLLTRVQLAF